MLLGQNLHKIPRLRLQELCAPAGVMFHTRLLLFSFGVSVTARPVWLESHDPVCLPSCYYPNLPRCFPAELQSFQHHFRSLEAQRLI